MADIRGFTDRGARAIFGVHAALEARGLTRHFDEALVELRWDPSRCVDGAVACVSEEDQRVVFFAMSPEDLRTRKLGLVLLHEAEHWQWDMQRGWFFVLHRCAEQFCRGFGEKEADPIYVYETRVIPQIRSAIIAVGLDPDRSWSEIYPH